MIPLLAIAVQKTRNTAIAEELVQDSFLKFYGHKQVLNELTSVKAYLYVILKNKILNHYRNQDVRRKYENYKAVSFQESDDATLSYIDTRELEKQLDAEIENLSPQCRTVFKLSRKEFLSNKEIAIRLNISENTVEQHTRKALKHLRVSLKEYLPILIVTFIIDYCKKI